MFLPFHSIKEHFGTTVQILFEDTFTFVSNGFAVIQTAAHHHINECETGNFGVFAQNTKIRCYIAHFAALIGITFKHADCCQE